mgnify:CR=1 FL=1
MRSMDTYDIGFKAKVDAVEPTKLGSYMEFVPIGDDWISYTTDTAVMIKAVCGSYPSDWDGMSCLKLAKILEDGIRTLKEDNDEYAQYEPKRGHGTVAGTISFLSDILRNCEKYPFAYVVVNIG